MKSAPSSLAFQGSSRDAHDSAGRAVESAQHSVLGPTLVLRGDLSFGEPLIIQGEIHGSAIGTASVLLEKTARLNGKLSAELIQFRKGTLLNNVVLAGCIRKIPGR